MFGSLFVYAEWQKGPSMNNTPCVHYLWSNRCESCRALGAYEAEQAILQSPKLGNLGIITEGKRWGKDAKSVYVDLWKLGFDKNQKNGGAPRKKGGDELSGSHTTRIYKARFVNLLLMQSMYTCRGIARPRSRPRQHVEPKCKLNPRPSRTVSHK